MKPLDFLTELFFPSSCLGCGKPQSDENETGMACRACLSKVTHLTWPFCGLCGRRLLACAKCPTHKAAALEGVAAASDYTDPFIKKLVTTHKYKFVRELSAPLAKLLSKTCTDAFCGLSDKNVLLVPVPLHAKRKRWRGFNQSEDLARHTSRMLGYPWHDALSRTKATKPQVDILDPVARRKNVGGSFVVIAPDVIREKNIILVDDVSTSGATLESASRALKDSGAKTVWGLVVARG